MSILLVLVYGASIGAIAHYAMPGRDTRGAALAPMWTGVLAGAVWLAFSVAGLGVGSVWSWTVTASVAPIAAVGGLLVLTRSRRAHDRRRAREAGLVAP